MSNSDQDRPRIADKWLDIIKGLNPDSLTEVEAAAAARELNQYGPDCVRFVAQKLKNAPADELKLLLHFMEHLDHGELVDDLTEVVINRIVPLDLKMDYFRRMSELGYAIDSAFLAKLQETDELCVQLKSHLSAGNAEATARAISLIDDFVQLPVTLKLSLLEQLIEEGDDCTLPFLQKLGGHDEALDKILIEYFSGRADPDSVKILGQIAATSASKDVVKLAKKALYVLREKGIVIIDGETREEETIPMEESDDGEQAYATTYDTFGGRLLVLAIPSFSRMLVAQASIDDMRGLLRFNAVEMPRKRFKELLKGLKNEVQKQGISSLVQIDPDHCRLLLQEAYEINVEKGALIPEGYKSFRYRAKPNPSYSFHKLLESRISVTDDDLKALRGKEEALFGLPEVGILMVEKDQLLPYTKRYVEMAESKLVLDENQRRQRLEDIVADFTAEYFTPERLARLKRRLQETAYAYTVREKPETAREILTLVRSLDDHTKLNPHQFLRTFMVRSIIGTIQVFSQEAAGK